MVVYKPRKELARRFVCRDTSGNDDTRASVRFDCTRKELRKERIGIHFASCCKIKAPRRTNEFIASFESALLCCILSENLWMRLVQFRYGSFFGRSCQLCNFRPVLREVFFLAELHYLPRRVAEYYIKSARCKNIWE